MCRESASRVVRHQPLKTLYFFFFQVKLQENKGIKKKKLETQVDTERIAKPDRGARGAEGKVEQIPQRL